MKKIDKNGQLPEPNNSDTELQAERILTVLDWDVDVPDGLTEKVMTKKKAEKSSHRSAFSLSNYLQIAAVFAAAVLLGVLLGKNANLSSFNQKQSIEEKALLELKTKHHLTEDYSFRRL